MTSLDPDELHRTAKLLVDTGEAETLNQAEEALATMRLQIRISAEASATPAGQAACLTAVNTGHRAFLGGCTLVIDSDPECTVPWARGRRLSAAVAEMGATVSAEPDPDVPTVAIGNVARCGDRNVWATWSGWAAAVADDPTGRLGESGGFELAGVAAGALGVSEVFQSLTGSAIATNRNTGVSLWRPDLPYNADAAQGPTLEYLPAAMWLLGLGHLGQATAWSFGMLPYTDPSAVWLWLMDPDTVVKANLGTSLLAAPPDVGLAKTRLTARRLESLGMRTRVIERRFAPGLAVTGTEPLTAIAGFDNPAARAALGDVGFERITDLGLGGGAAYNDIMARTFPGPTQPRDAFKARPARAVDLTRYEKSIHEIIDAGTADAVRARCGMVDLAGTTASASFVGAVAGALGVADVLRALHQGQEYDVVNLDLRSGLTSAAPSITARRRAAIAYTDAARGAA